MSRAEHDLRAAFRRIAEALDLLSDEELRRLSDPQYSVEVRVIRRRAKDESSVMPPDISVDGVIAQITTLHSRDEAQAFLAKQFPSKKVLEVIARQLDIPIIRQDKVEDLRDKIVEATVGAKIRSQAIQGNGP